MYTVKENEMGLTKKDLVSYNAIIKKLESLSKEREEAEEQIVCLRERNDTLQDQIYRFDRQLIEFYYSLVKRCGNRDMDYCNSNGDGLRSEIKCTYDHCPLIDKTSMYSQTRYERETGKRR